MAREGGIARASERLHLTPQTISEQLSLLEEYLGVRLFTRVGRNLELSETGRLVLSYADEIFSLGGELEEVIRQLPADLPQLFHGQPKRSPVGDRPAASVNPTWLAW